MYAAARSDSRVRITLSAMKAIWNDAIIAESSDTIEVEGNQYFPASSVNGAYLRPSEAHSTCPWKGVASYYTLDVNGRQNGDAAWYYPDPKPAASRISGHVAFWKGVRVEP